MRKTHDSIKFIPYSTYGVVLGTSKYLHGGGVNKYFKHRIDAASYLFHHNKIRYIIVSGDNREKNYNEPKMMKKELIKKGIPSDFIYEDFYGINTLYSVLRVYKIFHQKKFTIISQKFHNERAIFIGNCLGLEVIGFNAKSINYDGKIQIREFFARIKALWDIFLILKESFLSDLRS
ncbi:SanA/YdcF family protein [Blattabacterium cuenoti]|uniref:SanA/YdcF family protein n=1 Tax=Blattabacterium cuenoti TaxID=1653831 RepID=UPI001EEA08E8|nr:ElyC/SanA/YdcF family protein [Blattabacterium cuenoti]